MEKCTRCDGDGGKVIHGEWVRCESCQGEGTKIYGIPRCCGSRMKWIGTDGSFEKYECRECASTESRHQSRL
jgi:hypothetical protein